jgi:hypothetical protein
LHPFEISQPYTKELINVVRDAGNAQKDLDQPPNISGNRASKEQVINRFSNATENTLDRPMPVSFAEVIFRENLIILFLSTNQRNTLIFCGNLGFHKK